MEQERFTRLLKKAFTLNDRIRINNCKTAYRMLDIKKWYVNAYRNFKSTVLV